MKAKFDRYKDSYMSTLEKSVSFSGKEAEFFTKVKVGYLLKIINGYWAESEQLKVLDVGCGIGRTDSYLQDCFQELHGIDISEGLLETAQKNNPWVCYQHYDGITFPYESDKFEVAFAICVLHHVPPAQWEQFIFQMKRVVKPGGLIIVFEHNPFNPLTLLAVKRCEFDEDAVLLAAAKIKRLFALQGLSEIKEKYILLTPFAKLAKLEQSLAFLPLGAQYYVSGVKSR